jgi:hypothetical protein
MNLDRLTLGKSAELCVKTVCNQEHHRGVVIASLDLLCQRYPALPTVDRILSGL